MSKRIKEPKLKALHTTLVSDGYDVPQDYTVFERNLQDDEKSKALHTTLSGQKYDVPQEYDVFARNLELGPYKKKVSAGQQELFPGGQATSPEPENPNIPTPTPEEYKIAGQKMAEAFNKHEYSTKLTPEKVDAFNKVIEAGKAHKEAFRNGEAEDLPTNEKLAQIKAQKKLEAALDNLNKVGAVDMAKPEDLQRNTESLVEGKEKMGEFQEIANDPGAATTQFVGSFNKSVISMVSAIPKEIAILAKPLDDFFGTGEPGKETQDYATYKAGEWIDRKAIEWGLHATDPDRDQRFWQSAIPSALGSVFGIVMSGGRSGMSAPTLMEAAAIGERQAIITSTKQAIGSLGTRQSIMGSTAMAVPEFEAAKRAGLSDDEALKVWAKNYLVGATEILPIQNALGRINKLSGGKLVELVKAGIPGGFEEGVQEIVQQTLTNKIAQGSYDPERDTFQDVLKSGGAGFFVGFILPGIGAAMNSMEPEQRIKTQRIINDNLKAYKAEQEKAPAQAPLSPEATVGEKPKVQPSGKITEGGQGQQEGLLTPDTKSTGVPESAPVETPVASTVSQPPVPPKAEPPVESIPKPDATTKPTSAPSLKVAKANKAKTSIEDFQKANGKTGEPPTAKEKIIAENLVKFSSKSFGRWGDPNFMGGTRTARFYLSNKKGIDIDTQAQDMSAIMNPSGDGNEITPQDIVDFVEKFPNPKLKIGLLKNNDVDDFNDAAEQLIEQNQDKFRDDEEPINWEEYGHYDAKTTSLMNALDHIDNFGITADNIQTPAIKEILSTDFLLDQDDVNNINTIIDYAQTEEGRKKIAEFNAKRSKRAGEVSGKGLGFPEVQNTESAEQRAAREEDLKLFLGEKAYNELKTEEKEQMLANQQKKPPIKFSTKPIKKSEAVQKELDDLFGELDKVLKGTLATGINPKAAIVGAKIVAKYVELGAVKFHEIAQDVYNQFGEERFREVFAALKAGYASHVYSTQGDDFTSLDELRPVRPEEFINTPNNDTGTATGLEPDSSGNKPNKQVGSEDVPNGRKTGGASAVTGVQGNVGAKDKSNGDISVPDSVPPVSSKRSDTGVDIPESEGRVAGRIGRGADNSGSSSTDEPGLQPEPNTTEQPTKNTGVQIGERLSHDDKVKLQEKANRNVKIVVKDKANIAESLPLLMPHQVENVYKAEQRFFNDPKEGDTNKGILYTDGTGTGKTYTGIGIIKRFERMGKKDVLIVVPTDAKAKDWQDEARQFDLHFKQLESIQDSGEPGSMVVTTYANYRQNEALQNRGNKKAFDLVLYDESHKIIANEDGDQTSSDIAHKSLTNAPNSAWSKARNKFQKQYDKAYGFNGSYQERNDVNALINKEAKRLSEQTKVVFLSASPFAWHKTLLYADGYLFNIMQGEREPGKAFNNFFVSNFGYHIKNNKLNKPAPEVDISMFERAFHTKLVKSGAVSSTRLQLDKDYSREFVLVDDKAGLMIDEGFRIATDSDTYKILPRVVQKKFDYLYRSQLLEAIKAKRGIERIQQHLDMGRKVVVFHTYVNAVPSHPFDWSDPKLYPTDETHRDIINEIQKFDSENPQFRAMDFNDLINPIKTLKDAFGDKVRVFNGSVSKTDRRNAIREFNKDGSNVPVLVVQMEAGKEGISLHDITGNTQRALVSLGLPVKPTDSIQSEGRIYRIGQMSDAVVEYLVLHTNFEKNTFAMQISQRASTAENLAFGEQARNLKDAFKEGYKNPTQDPPSTNQGKGGRDADMVFDTMDPFTLATKLYYNRAKRTAKNKSQEGSDYFATPEPLGFKMAEWLYPQANQKLLEPSAGHGAIGRFFPENTANKFIEPSNNLRADLAINVNGDVLPGSFEDFHITNKFDGIAMNPPFGNSSKTAWEHLNKAMGHLRDGGRVIAIVPAGPSMDKRIDAWLETKDSKDFYITAKIMLPSVTFERAGTSVSTQLLIIDKNIDVDAHKLMPQRRDIDLRDIETADDLFARIKDMEMPAPLRTTPTFETVVEQNNEVAPRVTGSPTEAVSGDTAQVVAGVHTKYGTKIWTVRMLKRLSSEEFDKSNAKAKVLDGYYSRYTGNGALTGFIFSKGFQPGERAQKLANYMNQGFNDDPTEPTDPYGKNDTYNMLGDQSKGKVLNAKWESRTYTPLTNAKQEPFKIFKSVIDLANKYNPTGNLAQDGIRRGVQGSFYARSGAIRLKGLTSLSVAMHEIVHALDKGHGIIENLIATTKQGDKTRSRLTDIYEQYYPEADRNDALRKRMVEGYATLVEKYIITPSIINKQYPDLVQEFLTPGGKYWKDVMGPFVQDVSQVIAEYQGLSPIEKFQSRVTNDVIDSSKDSDTFSTLDKVTAQIWDNVWPVEKIAKLTGTQFTQDDVSLWLRLSKNAYQIAEQNISSKKNQYWGMDDNGQWKIVHNFNYETLVKSLDKRGLSDTYGGYLYARRLKFEFDSMHEQEELLDNTNSPAYLHALMGSMGISQEQAKQIQAQEAADIENELKRLSDILTNEGFTEEEAQEAYDQGKDMFANDDKMFDALTDGDLEFAHNPMIQLLDDEGYNKFKSREGYAPTKRAFYNELVGEQVTPLDKGAPKNKVSQFLTRKGSDKPIMNPLMSAMENHAEIVRKGLKQLVYNELLKTLDKHTDVLSDVMKEMPLDINPDPKNRYPQERDSTIIMARKDFKRVPIQVNSYLKEVLDENFDFHNSHLIETALVTASQMFRAGTTGFWAQFSLINFLFLDQPAAFVNSKNSFIPIFSPSKEMGKAILFKNSMEAAYLKEYLFLSGNRQFALTADNASAKSLRDIIAGNKTKADKAGNFFKKVANVLSLPSSFTETMTRGTEYIMARKAGKEQQQALEEAGRVSAPFHHTGRLGRGLFGNNSDVGKTYVRSVPYFGSSLQVLRQSKRSLETNTIGLSMEKREPHFYRHK